MSDNPITVIPNRQNISQIHFKSTKENRDKKKKMLRTNFKSFPTHPQS